MAVLPIVRMGNPVLRTPAAPVPLAALAEPATQQWIDDMIETMHDADGVGLAAPQVGVAWQLFVYQAEDDDDPEGGIALAVGAMVDAAIVVGAPAVRSGSARSSVRARRRGLRGAHRAARVRPFERRPLSRPDARSRLARLPRRVAGVHAGSGRERPACRRRQSGIVSLRFQLIWAGRHSPFAPRLLSNTPSPRASRSPISPAMRAASRLLALA